MSEAVQAGGAPKPVGHYPHARRVGDLLFLSGIGPRDPVSNAIVGNVHDADGRLISYDIDAQCRAVFANVRAVLQASGAHWEDLVDYNQVWAEYFPDAATAPCRTTLGITALPTPISIELKCIARLAKDADR
ncbi:MAG: 2-aminomuconate deaminase [Stenotrophomonas acidaminiphila]|nr:MAG: 2-aminomuconate deaminase [Stenotrophomonas acidaminiphila]